MTTTTAAKADEQTNAVLDQIEELADIDVPIAALPLNESYVWFAIPDAKGVMRSTVFTIGQAAPMDPNTKIIAWYENDTEVRVYCGLTKKPAGVERDEDIRHKRYTLCKAAPTFGVATMPAATLITEMASELQELREATMLRHDFEDDDPVAPATDGDATDTEAGDDPQPTA